MAKKRRKDFVPRCKACGPISIKVYTRHHMVPRADPRFEDHLKEHGKAVTIALCTSCHDLVRKTFGEGHRFTGPTTVRHLVRWLKIKNEQRTNQDRRQSVPE